MDAEDVDMGTDMDVDVDVEADADVVDADMDAMEAGRPSVEGVEAGEPIPGEDRAETAMVVPELEPTGNVDVDAALERLRVLSERPTGAHPDLYDGVHQRLQEVLAQIDHQDAGR